MLGHLCDRAGMSSQPLPCPGVSHQLSETPAEFPDLAEFSRKRDFGVGDLVRKVVTSPLPAPVNDLSLRECVTYVQTVAWLLVFMDKGMCMGVWVSTSSSHRLGRAGR